MRKLGLGLLSMAVLCCTAFATTTDELILSSGGLTATFQDNVVGCTGTGCAGLAGDKSSIAGTLSVSGVINGWTITVVSGVSKSPILTPQALNVSSFTASCNSGQGCASGVAGDLDVQFSDVNFNVPVGAGVQTNYRGTITGGEVTSISENAYFYKERIVWRNEPDLRRRAIFNTHLQRHCVWRNRRCRTALFDDLGPSLRGRFGRFLV